MSNCEHVFVGISLSNKGFTSDVVKRSISASVRDFGATTVLFLIADEIELLNLRVYGKDSESVNRRRVGKRRAEIEAIIDEGRRAYSGRNVTVRVTGWQEILNRTYWDAYIELFGLYSRSEEFRNALLAVAKKHAARRRVVVDDDRARCLCLYMLAELPTLIVGVTHDGNKYQGMIYPSIKGEEIDEIATSIVRGDYARQPKLIRSCRVVKLRGQDAP